eukprot:3769799-Lingulodinium_polyedra.AAC.1
MHALNDINEALRANRGEAYQVTSKVLVDLVAFEQPPPVALELRGAHPPTGSRPRREVKTEWQKWSKLKLRAT